MNFKKLFVNDGDGEEDQTKTNNNPVSTKFPTSDTTTSTNIFSGLGFGSSQTSSFISSTPAQVSQEHLDKAMEIYQNGFDSLNQPGYDFYEYFQSVTHGGIDNPQIYTMAFAMGIGMEKTMSKDKLLQQSEFYVNEINKVYNDYITKGNAKKQDLVVQKNSENQSLINELEVMKQQLEALKIQMTDRENKLKAIGGKYEPLISDIESKLAANDIAKNKLVDTIEQVKKGIINNLK